MRYYSNSVTVLRVNYQLGNTIGYIAYIGIIGMIPIIRQKEVALSSPLPRYLWLEGAN